ncbi:phospho-N-acetylmuramoyl-pentapeptide-transferase [Desulfitibacter alkalitolerans]|uniref:phospho-N-acetylmuramoyl-pentapeptide- transferase n=1 Tax=Desulfitibacter alkalitolerans TaxID=264641 RepID=UPI0004873AF8|nr:phospho-N-acetylmuramoyl-pentapeptide-transferase [Desulfitibacter alkalitolerans]
MVYLVTFGVAAISTVILGPLIIPILRSLKIGQTIRSDGPKRHFGKAGTPTMGGLIFLIPIIIASLFISPPNLSTGLLILMTLGFGIIGFTDDYLKVVLRRSLGLKARWKLAGQILLSLILAFIAVVFLDRGTNVWIPFVGELYLGWLYLPFVTFVVVGTTNAVNLTDGLDGLAAGTSAVAALGFLMVSIILDNHHTAIFSAALAGGCIGFLVFNAYPARVFMGDTGSLAIGAAIATLAVLTRTEILLAVIGGIFVVETFTVILQVISFKTTGKRLFLMSPLHHHYELKGWGERKIVLIFYLISIVFAFLGVALLKYL